MKLTLKEMNGLLNGKCLPSDLIFGETLAEYLVRKFAELDLKLAESQREFRAADATIENMQMQVEKLAAENSGLKALCEDRRTFIMNGVQLGYIQVPTVETDPALETIRVAVSPQAPTPATDAFLAEVRAQGVEMFAKKCSEKSKHAISSDTRDSWRLCGEHAGDFAAQLRQEDAQ